MDLGRGFGYGVSLLSAVCGADVIAGFGIPEGVPSRLRITMGIVLVLLGIYRFSVTKMKSGVAARERV